MPLKNHFRHQEYTDRQPKSSYALLTEDFPPQKDSEGYSQAMIRFADAIRGQVDSIYLIHGTFAGTDSLGWVAQLGKIWPAASEQLRDARKRVFDSLAKDTGNYTKAFADQLRGGLSDANLDLPVRLFNWSSENTHVGRAIAAVELLELLAGRAATEKQIQLWCHSHAGNVLALVTNLIGATPPVRMQFLDLVRPMLAAEMMETVEAAFAKGAYVDLSLDVVTFGTPVRYGWDTGGYRKLLHFVNHVAREGSPPFLGTAPKFSTESLSGNLGDFVQQLGIAGTDFLPYILDFRLMRAERALSDLLQPGLFRTDLLERIKLGMRVPDEGETLLIDYEDFDGLARDAGGHGVYTKEEWLSFHADEIAKRYGVRR